MREERKGYPRRNVDPIRTNSQYASTSYSPRTNPQYWNAIRRYIDSKLRGGGVLCLVRANAERPKDKTLCTVPEREAERR